LGLLKPIKDLAFQLEFNSLAHLVQKLTTYEQHHPKLYQDRFKRQVTLIDTEDAKDSGDGQEVAVAEWTRGANPVSCKWVKQQGPGKGFDFDVSKVEQIFDLLLKEKQLKLPERCKLPTAQELQGDHIASGITLSLTTLATAKDSVGGSNQLSSKAD
jgi:hypothetical protein